VSEAAGAGADLPRWPAVVGTVACALGLGVAGYLTYEHYTSSTSLACADNGVINCLKVTTSSYSEVAGVPVALLGLIFFAVMLVLQLPVMWRRTEMVIRWIRLGWATIGLGTVLYLFYTELFRIDAICLWCTSVHVLTLIVFGSTVFASLAYPLHELEGAGVASSVPNRGR
jgi:uncharacterized membrane protein